MTLVDRTMPLSSSAAVAPPQILGNAWDLVYGFMTVLFFGGGLVVLLVSIVRTIRKESEPPSPETWVLGLASFIGGGLLIVTKAIGQTLASEPGIGPWSAQVWLLGAVIAALAIVAAVLAVLLYRSRRREAAAAAQLQTRSRRRGFVGRVTRGRGRD